MEQQDIDQINESGSSVQTDQPQNPSPSQPQTTGQFPSANQTSQFQKRQVAHKISINDILDSQIFKGEGWNPSYMLIRGERKISRVNILGTVIEKPVIEDLNYKSLTLDDGSANIGVRAFDNKDIINNVEIGDSILVIGRPREFGSEKYITPEIIKKIDNPNWIRLRILELGKKAREITQSQENKDKEIEEVKVYDVEEKILTDEESIISLVKKLDSDDGADLNDVIERLNNPNSEKMIETMIKRGELFEIRPGKIKVLE